MCFLLLVCCPYYNLYKVVYKIRNINNPKGYEQTYFSIKKMADQHQKNAGLPKTYKLLFTFNLSTQ